jgi:hypothetical protein
MLTQDQKKQTLITETVKAIVELSEEFAKKASADALLTFEDILPGRPTQGVVAEVTALQPEDRRLAATDDDHDFSLKIYNDTEEGALKHIMPLRSTKELSSSIAQKWAGIFNNIIEFRTMEDLFFNGNVSDENYSGFIARIDLPSLIQSMRFLLGEEPDNYIVNRSRNPLAASHLQIFLSKLGINEASFDSILRFIEMTKARR